MNELRVVAVIETRIERCQHKFTQLGTIHLPSQ